MSKNSYKNAEGAFGGVGIAASAVGAGATFGNPAGGVINAQNAYHDHQYKKAVRICPLPLLLPQPDLLRFFISTIS